MGAEDARRLSRRDRGGSSVSRTIQIILNVTLGDKDPRTVDETADLIMRSLPRTPSGTIVLVDRPPMVVDFVDAEELAP